MGNLNTYINFIVLKFEACLFFRIVTTIIELFQYDLFDFLNFFISWTSFKITLYILLLLYYIHSVHFAIFLWSWFSLFRGKSRKNMAIEGRQFYKGQWRTKSWNIKCVANYVVIRCCVKLTTPCTQLSYGSYKLSRMLNKRNVI